MSRARPRKRIALQLTAAWLHGWRAIRTVTSRRVGRVLQILVVLVCLGNARRVAASEIVIEWNAPAECPDRAEIESRVVDALGDAVAPNLTAIADVTRAATSFRARLRITSSAGFGERTLENTRCEILADSVALVIALSASPSVPRDDQDQGVAFGLSAHATAVTGPLPRLALGGGGTLALEGLWGLRLELSGTYYAKQVATFDQADIGGKFSLLRVGARGCRAWSVGAFDLGPCLGAQLYRIKAVGFGGMDRSSGASLMWGAALGVFGRLRLFKHLAVYIAADGVIPVARQQFVFSDIGPLHRPSALIFQLFVAPEVQF